MPETLKTKLWLPPGALTPTCVKRLLRLCLERYAWFVPKKVEVGIENMPLKHRESHLGELVDVYKKNAGRLHITGASNQVELSISPDQYGRLSYLGSVTWWVSRSLGRKAAWHEAHVGQISELMRLLDSPLATTALSSDYDEKLYRYVPNRSGGVTQKLTTYGYDEGLVGLFWRNFFGPPFVRLFGDKLKTLPGARDLGGVWLVEPYESPEQAGTKEARARERELIRHIGPECFYDRKRKTKATRVLPLPRLESNEPKPTQPPKPSPPAVKKKLAEHWAWAKKRWEEEGSIVRKTGKGYVLLAKGSSALTQAVLNWAHQHTDDPLFLKRSPDEVAMYLQAKHEALTHPPSLDPQLELTRIRSTLGESSFRRLIELIPVFEDVEAAVEALADKDPQASKLLPRLKGLRKLGELLTFIPSRPR